MNEDDVRRLIEELSQGDAATAERAEREIHTRASHVVVTEDGHTPDAKLEPDSLPFGTRDQVALSRLAMSFHAYVVFRHAGLVKTLGNVMLRTFKQLAAVPITTTGIRTALFMECRRRVHTASVMTDDDASAKPCSKKPP